MSIVYAVLVTIFVSFVMSAAHEKDIYNACEKHGSSAKAGWFIDIKCTPMNTN